ncbi:phosphate ABC transporter permease PstA [Calderihabitans maritimus]|uniref:Phosphate transport system permease protein PstA n=1 Tax=Calderihabitans maritimus TaxID=1246530 RepID=A0A1Z5HW37_9FIRM|nr:phosphate ABC transporter permease PstA [Calderihabitans maritimus]GAW93567.1 phosphate ABC transporter permease [Calderihabitans maritimus]
MNPRLWEKTGFLLLQLAAWMVLLFMGVIFYDLTCKGIGAISWEFLTTPPRKGMTEGGILPAIVGTFYVTMVTAIFAVPLGIFAAIYLHEYARQGRLTRLIRMSIRNLAGVPSIVYGLFGVALFVQIMRLGTSILSAGLTLGLLTLPVIITSSEEALKAVPQSYREGALALGATRWQAIRTNVLPLALPGMLTGVILGLARAAGETAPILFTGVAFFLPRLPDSLFSQFMALPYHLYILSTQHHAVEQVRPLAYGTALVLLTLIFTLNLVAVILRTHFRRKFKNTSI